MAREEILEKLGAFLTLHNPITEECHAVYLMVEIRKVIDQLGAVGRYPLLKFYADWTVHSTKDRISREISAILEPMYAAAVANIADPGLEPNNVGCFHSFAHMRDLRAELQAFLGWQNVGPSPTNEGATWLAFVRQLVRVLESQPIIDPCENVRLFSFEPADDGHTTARLAFRDAVGGRRDYAYTNAY